MSRLRVTPVAPYALALHALRLIVAFVPGMWLWGLNAQAFAPAAAGWSLWLATLAAIAMAVLGPEREATTPRAPAGGRYPVALAIAAALASGTITWALDDRVWFLGDFILRAGSAARGSYLLSFPQSMPGDLLVHSRLAPALGAALHAPALLGARIVGALEAAALGLAAVHAAHTLGARRAHAWAVTLVLLSQGTLLLCTGLGKGITEVAILSMLMLSVSIGESTRPRPSILPELILVAALWMHRSALALVPVWLVLLPGRARPAIGARPGPGALALRVALVLLGVAPLLTRYVHVLASFDAPRHLFAGAAPGVGTLLALVVSPLHLLDVLNVTLLLAPGLLFLPVLVGGVAGRPRAERRIMTAALAPWALLLLVVQPQQGLFRDLDVFAPFASVASMFVGWLLCGGRDAARRQPTRTATLVAIGAAFAIAQLLVVHHVPDSGVARALAFAAEPPVRAEAVRAQVWDYLGDRAVLSLQRGQAAQAYRTALDLAPTPRRQLSAVIAAMVVHDHAWVRAECAGELRANPRSVIGLMGYRAACEALGDTARATEALDRLCGLVRASAESRVLMEEILNMCPELGPVPSPICESPLAPPLVVPKSHPRAGAKSGILPG